MLGPLSIWKFVWLDSVETIFFSSNLHDNKLNQLEWIVLVQKFTNIAKFVWKFGIQNLV